MDLLIKGGRFLVLELYDSSAGSERVFLGKGAHRLTGPNGYFPLSAFTKDQIKEVVSDFLEARQGKETLNAVQKFREKWEWFDVYK